jgi:hypothetical protein
LSKGQVAGHGIAGMVINIMQAARDVDNKALTAAREIRTKMRSICKQYPGTRSFPQPLQKLMSKELNAMPERISKGKRPPTFEDDSLTCQCLFARQYLLPRKRLFNLNIEYKVLSDGQIMFI